ncbi:MAG: long-chain-fatty-acid--CoA ligase [Deltaproteobacteria bacterium]|nr:long-chain-fatty-acid--CoA ligase [Deltaproteobacteria bacterium]
MVVGEILARNARKFPKKEALVFEKKRATFSEVNERVNRLATTLLEMGVKKGDRIGVLLHNCHQFVEIYFASAKIGAIFCPYNNHFRQKELTYIINYSEPKVLFIDSEFSGLVYEIKKDLGSVEHYVCLSSPEQDEMMDYEELILRGKNEEPDVQVNDDDICSMIFTAGTTGRPKGALRSHRHVIMNAISGVIELKVDYDEKVLVAFPLYHVAGEDNIVRHFFMPNTIFLRREGKFNAKDILSYIEREKITRCQLVPTMIHTLIQDPDIDKYDLSSLRLILYAGAPMPVELLRKALTIFKCGFAQLYGQTESGPLTTILKPEDHVLENKKSSTKLASSGKPVISCELRIVDENDNDVPVGSIGEIVVRGECIMKGYWRMEEETKKKLKNGWLHTGDLGKMDEDGYVYIVERKDDLIISGGVNIYPREIEEVLYTHPKVSEASVVGVPDEHWGEIVKAIIVLKEGMEATEDEIVEFCAKHLASYKKPKSVEFWRELPKSPQGKILKREIKEMLSKRRNG